MRETFAIRKKDRPGSSVAARIPFLLTFLILCLGPGCSMFNSLSRLAIPAASAKLMFACIPAKTSIDTPSGPRAIEQLQAGDTVIGFDGKPVHILQKHAYMENPSTEFLRVSFENGSAVDLCGMHRIDGIRAKKILVGQKLAGQKVATIEPRHGETLSFDLLTEDAGYRIQGIPVNSMIEEMQQASTAGLRQIRE